MRSTITEATKIPLSMVIGIVGLAAMVVAWGVRLEYLYQTTDHKADTALINTDKQMDYLVKISNDVSEIKGQLGKKK